MSKARKAPQIPLFSGCKEPQNYDIYVYGSDDPAKMAQDTFANALDRYLDKGDISGNRISARCLSILSGVSKSSISYYLGDERRVTYESLCAICIALRLHPMRQRHLFCKSHHLMPADEPYPNERDKIIRISLESCAYIEGYTVLACNDLLVARGYKPLTSLISKKEDRR